MGSDALEDRRFVGYRRKLIEDIRARGVDDLEILQLFDRVPRHHFLPEGMWPRAYEDAPIPIGFGQTASQPSLQAHYLTILRPKPDEKVLEIGTGCGYLTALLSLMADRVYSIERIRELSTRARKALDAFGVKNAALMVGDGTIGWKNYAPWCRPRRPRSLPRSSISSPTGGGCSFPRVPGTFRNSCWSRRPASP